jgi:hypothetical protein
MSASKFREELLVDQNRTLVVEWTTDRRLHIMITRAAPGQDVIDSSLDDRATVWLSLILNELSYRIGKHQL